MNSETIATSAAQVAEAKLNGGLEAIELPELHALPVGDLLRLELPERPKLFPWLPEGGLILVYGPRGIGKTFFTLGLASSLVTGSSFIRWEPTKAVGVLYVDGEMQLGDLRERIVRQLDREAIQPFEIISHEYVFMKTQRDINLGLQEWQGAIGAYLEDNPQIRVVILDNLACLLPTIAEDKRDDWSERVMPFLIALRRRGVAVIMVHHAGKSGAQRGTSSREDHLDAVIKLKEVSDHDATRGAQFVVTFTKCRSAYGDEVKDFETRIEDQDGALIWTWKDVEESNETRLINLVHDGIDNVRDAAVEMDVTPGYISKLKKTLVAKGRLKAGRALELADEI